MSDVLERMKGSGNWETQNTTSLLEFGKTFPEFRRSATWQARGLAGALQNCLDNAFPDGALREATTNYHTLSLNRYMGVLESAGYEVTPGGDAAARHRRIVVFLKPSLFFVVDTARGTFPHDWTLRHHFAPGALAASQDGKSINFRPASDPHTPDDRAEACDSGARRKIPHT